MSDSRWFLERGAQYNGLVVLVISQVCGPHFSLFPLGSTPKIFITGTTTPHSVNIRIEFRDHFFPKPTIGIFRKHANQVLAQFCNNTQSRHSESKIAESRRKAGFIRDRRYESRP